MDGIVGLALKLFLASFAWASLPVDDNEFQCTDSQQAQNYIYDLNINLSSFGGLELCSPHSDAKKLFNDLEIIRQGQFAEPPSNTFIREFIPKESYFDWLKQQTRGIERANDMPYATAYNRGGHFTLQDGWAQLSTLGRVGTLIHEARHTEGFYHTRCTHGPYQDSWVSGCDADVSQGGSHGVEMEYYARVYLAGQNFHPLFKSMAKLMLLARANFVFNHSAMAAHDELLVRTSTGLIRLNGVSRQFNEWQSPLPTSFTLKRTSFGATLLDNKGESWALHLSPEGQVRVTEDEYSYYKLLEIQPPAELADLEEIDIGTRRYMLALSKTGLVYSYLFGSGQWSNPSMLPGAVRFATVSPEGDSGAFIVFSNSSYCALDVEYLKCLQPTQLWPKNARAFLFYQGSLLHLDQAGVIRFADGRLLPELGSLPALDAVQIPIYDAFREP